MYDNVIDPIHYNWHPSGVETKEVTDDLPSWIGYAIAYIWRRNHKGRSIDDRIKAIEWLNEATPERFRALHWALTPEVVNTLMGIEPEPDSLLYDVRVLITGSLLGIEYPAWQQIVDRLKSDLQYELDELAVAGHDSSFNIYKEQ